MIIIYICCYSGYFIFFMNIENNYSFEDLKYPAECRLGSRFSFLIRYGQSRFSHNLSQFLFCQWINKQGQSHHHDKGHNSSWPTSSTNFRHKTLGLLRNGIVWYFNFLTKALPAFTASASQEKAFLLKCQKSLPFASHSFLIAFTSVSYSFSYAFCENTKSHRWLMSMYEVSINLQLLIY